MDRIEYAENRCDWPFVKELCDEHIAKGESTLRVQLALARSLAMLGNKTAACDVFRESLHRIVDPMQDVGIGDRLIETFALLDFSHWSGSTSELQQDLCEALISIGIYLGESDDTVGALRFLGHAAGTCPNHPKAHLNLGVALAQAGNSESAIVSFERALELDPNYAEAHLALANARVSCGDDRAIDSYQKALTLKPSNINFVLPMARYFSNAKRSGSITLYQQALRLTKPTASLNVELANAAIALGQLGTAKRHSTAALQLAPDSPQAHISLGTANRCLGELSRAEACYRLALALDNKSESLV